MCLFDLSGEKRRRHQAAQDRRVAVGVGVGLTVGALAGAIAGLLLAPQSGKETRAVIKDTTGKAAHNIHTAVSHKVSQTKEKLSHVSDACCKHHEHDEDTAEAEAQDLGEKEDTNLEV